MAEVSWTPILAGLFVFLSSALALAFWPSWNYRRKQELAIAAVNAKDWTEAEARSQDALEAVERLGRDRLRATFAMGVLLCRALQQQRLYAEAEAEARRLLGMSLQVRTQEERTGLALVWVVLGDILLDLGRLPEAEAAATEAEALGATGHEGYDIWHLGLRTDIARRKGQYREALQGAAAMQRAMEGASSPSLRQSAPLAALLRSAMCAEALQPDKGLAAAEELLERTEPESDLRLEAVNVTGYILARQNRMEDAERTFREGLALVTERHGEEDWHRALPLINLANVLARQGMAQEATAFLSEAGRFEAQLKGDERSALLYGRGLVMAVNGRLDEAEKALRESVALEEARSRVGHPATMDGLWALSHVVDAAGRAEEAEALRMKVAAIRSEFAGVV